MNPFSRSVSVMAILLATGCTWVKPETGGEQVALRQMHEVAQCQKKGNVEVKTLPKVGFVQRSTTKIASELLTLAQNEAVVLGGNAVVPTSSVENGAQRFAVYRCRSF